MWIIYLNLTDLPFLDNQGSRTNAQAQTIAHERYEQFHAKRQAQKLINADSQDWQELQTLEIELKKAK